MGDESYHSLKLPENSIKKGFKFPDGKSLLEDCVLRVLYDHQIRFKGAAFFYKNPGASRRIHFDVA
jgi:hypothetical protein